jgi:hypothetical protein
VHYESFEHNVADGVNDGPQDDRIELGFNRQLAQNHNSVMQTRAAALFPICNIASTKLCANVLAAGASIGA